MCQKIIFTIFFVTGMLSAIFAPAQEYMDLHYQFTKGDQFQLIQHSSQETYLTLNGEKDRTSNETNATLSLTITGIQAGNATIEASYKQINLQSSSHDQQVSVNTQSDADDIFNRLFKGLIGKKFTIVLQKNGTIKKVNGLDEIIDQMVANVKGVKSDEKTALRNLLESQFGPEALRSSLVIALPYYPPQKVHTGDSWMNQLYTEGFYHARIDNYWKLDYGNKFVIKLSNQGKFNTDATQEVDLGGGQKGYIDLNGKIEGKYVVDPETHWPTSCILHTELAGNYIYKSSKKRKRDVEVPVRVVINTRYQVRHL
jgi:hypothetical protein